MNSAHVFLFETEGREWKGVSGLSPKLVSVWKGNESLFRSTPAENTPLSLGGTFTFQLVRYHSFRHRSSVHIPLWLSSSAETREYHPSSRASQSKGPGYQERNTLSEKD